MARTSSNNLNKTRYTRRDYESIKSDLINAIPSLTQEWTSREEADPGIVLIKLMAMFGDTLSYNVDKIALELYIQTVTQRKNCAKILRLLGYKMHWYRSARVMAHVKLEMDQDAQGNIGRIILTPYETQFIAGTTRYTVVSQGYGSGQIDIYSDTSSTPVQLIEGTPVTATFDKSTLVNNRYYFGNYNLDETEIVLTIDNITNTRITCELTQSLYLVSSNTVIYYEFGVDEYDRPYIELCDGWEDIAGSDTAEFTVTYILSSGSLGNISSNAFSTNIYNYIADGTNTSNLVISNLSNSTKYGENGEDLDSYNSPGYDPQSVYSARVDSAKYVFTHDTLVTSSDYEKGCKRADDQITVSKMVDAQVIINDQLDLDDICNRALDHFSKVYVEEDSLSNSDETEVNQYLLPYQVIMYLAYQNFNSRYNYYSNLNDTSFWSLKSSESDNSSNNPYDKIYWNPTTTYIGDGSNTTFELSGAESSDINNQVVKVKVTVNELEYTSNQFTRNDNVITITENIPDSVGNSIAINTNSNIEIIDSFSYDQGNITFNDSLPAIIDNIVINYDNKIGHGCSYTSGTDSIIFDTAPESNAIIKVTKLYSMKYPVITLKSNVPDSITSLFINGTSVGDYDYSKPNIIFTKGDLPEINSLIVNGVPTTDFEVLENGLTIEEDSPGYYPYKPTDNILLSVRDLLKTLKVLNVQVDFGTMKVFPFKVEGTVHLIETVDPFEAVQIIDIIDEALVQAYYPDLHPVGEKPDFIEIVDIIQNADPRIRYFDAVNNIVEWAPEVQRRLTDMDKIFDTTSAIMYNGLSDSFNLSKRFMHFKFKNTATNLDPEEEALLQIEDSEIGAINVPSDYGTAYLVNYSKAAGMDYVVSVLKNSYITLQLNNTAELRALCEDITYKGFEYIDYIRTLTDDTNNPYEVSATEVTSDPQALYTFYASPSTLTYELEEVSTDIDNSGTLTATVTDANGETHELENFDDVDENDYIGYEGSIAMGDEYFELTIDQFFRSELDEEKTDPSFNTGIQAIACKAYADGVEVSYRTATLGQIQVVGTFPAGTVIKIVYYLDESDMITVKYKYYGCSLMVSDTQYLDKILYLNAETPDADPSTCVGDLYSIEVEGNEYLRSEFSDPDSGEISEDFNSDLFYEFNERTYTEDGTQQTTFNFKFNNPGYVYYDIKNIADEIDRGQPLNPGDSKITKNVLINNTGMQWIKED